MTTPDPQDMNFVRSYLQHYADTIAILECICYKCPICLEIRPELLTKEIPDEHRNKD